MHNDTKFVSISFSYCSKLNIMYDFCHAEICDLVHVNFGSDGDDSG